MQNKHELKMAGAQESSERMDEDVERISLSSQDSDEFEIADNELQAGVTNPEIDFKKQIENDVEELLASQREGRFTFRVIDFCHSAKVLLEGVFLPCVLHGRNVKELGIGKPCSHGLLCLLSPFGIGSYYSVGMVKTTYRNLNSIPGLSSDDCCVGCVFPCCTVIQIRNELNEKRSEERQAQKIYDMLADGLHIKRD